MTVKIRCPNPACGKAGSVAPELVGHAVRCIFCGLDFTATAASTANKTQLAPRAAVTNLGKDLPTFTAAPLTASSAMPQRIGRFQVRAILGRGAFGVVYRAYDAGLDREIALKVPHPKTLESPKAIARFLDEGKAAGRLYHSHIVPVFEAGSADGHYYLASAFIQGQTLAEILTAGPLSVPRAVRLTAAIADALSHAHGQGIIHRDVKPSNVVVDARGHPFLMDFGIARMQDSGRNLTRLGDVLGTPGYLSPEQAAGQPATAASDQYSAGVMLYEILCGQKPFAGPAAIVLYHTINTAPPPLQILNAAVPPNLESICFKAMAKRALDRFASCQELAEVLRRYEYGGQSVDSSRENVGVVNRPTDASSLDEAFVIVTEKRNLGLAHRPSDASTFTTGVPKPFGRVRDVSDDELLEYALEDAALKPGADRAKLPAAVAPFSPKPDVESTRFVSSANLAPVGESIAKAVTAPADARISPSEDAWNFMTASDIVVAARFFSWTTKNLPLLLCALVVGGFTFLFLIGVPMMWFGLAAAATTWIAMLVAAGAVVAALAMFASRIPAVQETRGGRAMVFGGAYVVMVGLIFALVVLNRRSAATEHPQPAPPVAVKPVPGVAPPAPLFNSRTRWVHSKGSFIKTTGKEWIEKGGENVVLRFEEIARTDDYVELKRSATSVTIRLYRDRSEISFNGRQFPGHQGAWEQP